MARLKIKEGSIWEYTGFGPKGDTGPIGPTGANSTVPGPTGPLGPTGPAGPSGTQLVYEANYKAYEVI